MAYNPKGETATRRAIKRARAQGYRIHNDERRASGEQVKGGASNRRRKPHGRAR
jgi:hypothetical protein